MATTLTRQGSGSAAVTYVAADAAGNNFANGGQEGLHVRNAGGVPCVVTINSQRNCDQGFDHDTVVSVPAGSDRVIRNLDPSRFNDGNGRANVTYDQVASVTVGVI